MEACSAVCLYVSTFRIGVGLVIWILGCRSRLVLFVWWWGCKGCSMILYHGGRGRSNAGSEAFKAFVSRCARLQPMETCFLSVLTAPLSDSGIRSVI